MGGWISPWRFITCWAKLLDADWLRKRAIFLNHEGTCGNQEGMITWCWLAEHTCIKWVSRFKRILKRNFGIASLLSLIYSRLFHVNVIMKENQHATTMVQILKVQLWFVTVELWFFTVQLWFVTVQLWLFTVQLWFLTQFRCNFLQFSSDFWNSSAGFFTVQFWFVKQFGCDFSKHPGF